MKKLYLLILIAFLPLLASADAVEINGLYYNLNASDHSAEVTSSPNMYSGIIVIPEKVTCDGVEYDVTTIGDAAFKDCTGLTSVTIPNSVTSIEAYTFWGCSNLSSIEIPNSVTSIGEYAFSNCSGLTSLTIPNNVTSIDAGVFYRCSGLTSVSIPNSWTRIPVSAFHFCSNLTTIEIPSSVTGIGIYAFCGCTNLSSIKCLAVSPPLCDFDSFGNHDIPLYVPDGCIDSYKAANEWKRFTNILPISLALEYDAVKIGDSGYGSFCSNSDLDFTDVDGLKAYTATGYDDDNASIWLTRIYHVPAGTGLIVKGTPGTTYQVPHKSTHSYYSNMLVGNIGPTITIYETDGDKTNYYLKSGKLLKVDGYATIGQYKSYLQVPTSVFARTRSIDFFLDDESGTTYVPHIVQHGETTDVYYNLNGQRVDNPTKGLYIRNGKVIVIK